EWNGRLFVQLEYADIAAWRTWVPFPVEFPSGSGALRLWMGFGDRGLKDIVADVRLADVKTRLAQDLPQLELAELSGRISWKQLADGFEFSTARLGLTAQEGLILHPADFMLRVRGGMDPQRMRGEVQANAIELQPLAALADRLPLSTEFRKRLGELAPKGSLYDVAVRWNGDWRQPAQYSARGRFQGLAMSRHGRIPGFSGISGNIDGNEKSGVLHLNTGGATLDMPLVFRDHLEFDAFTAQVAWSRDGDATDLRLNNISFSNGHLAGTLFGSYRAFPDRRGLIDLTGNLTRADARFASRYIPLVVGKTARDWLDRAFLAGHSNDVALRVKGNLDDFPFPDNKGGLFQVTAKVTGGVLDYGERWPRIEGIDGDLNFRGQRMDVHARHGSIMGARLRNVYAEIPDLVHPEEVLIVTGEAEGATGDFLGFIDKSPVGAMINHFTDGMRADGSGRLALRLRLPLEDLSASEVAGSYQFINNTVVGDHDLPPVEQVNGRLEFTESSVRAQNVSGVFLGGPVTISATTQRDSTVQLNLQGRANVDNLRRAGRAPSWMLSLRGSAEWRGSFTL
ncbi:MAG: hypothetical protein KIT18_17340, partial [Burkholderiales bacterium]|nr:hypothetical protein [Burkholderiales bacterium]